MSGPTPAWLAGSLLALSACASAPPEHYGRSTTPADPPAERDAASAKPGGPAGAGEAPPPDDVVLRAALPFRGIRNDDGAELGADALMSSLARADAICVGERHGNAHDHWAQLATIQGLLERRKIGGFELGVGFEMFPHPSQPLLDSYAEGRMDLDRLVQASNYEKLWGYPIQYYAPQLSAGSQAGAALLALNARRELTQAVARDGVAELSSEHARELPPLDLEDASHRALFDLFMSAHPPGGDPENMYAAQVVWDETMVLRAARWLSARAPARKLVILAGRAHCARSAIPQRLERHGSFRVLSVLPRVVPEGSIAEASADEPRSVATAEESELEKALNAQYDFQLLLLEP